MITSHAHISMTYQPPAPEPKHVHRIETRKPQAIALRARRTGLLRRLRLA